MRRMATYHFFEQSMRGMADYLKGVGHPPVHPTGDCIYVFISLMTAHSVWIFPLSVSLSSHQCIYEVDGCLSRNGWPLIYSSSSRSHLCIHLADDIPFSLYISCIYLSVVLPMYLWSGWLPIIYHPSMRAMALYLRWVGHPFIHPTGDNIVVFILEEGAPQSILSIHFIYQSFFPPIYLWGGYLPTIPVSITNMATYPGGVGHPPT